MTGFTVEDIAKITKGALFGASGGAAVTGGVIDSRLAGPGLMFCALRGERADGHDYIASALQKGSPVCLAERVPEGVGGGVIVVPDVQRAMAELAREIRGRFTGPVVGIVGTVRGTKGGKGLAIAALAVNIVSLVIVFGLQSAWSAALA